jgi:hypothetical protein
MESYRMNGVEVVRRAKFPKWESLKINPEEVAFFEPEKVTVNLPAFTSNPPQIHHRNTTFCTPFLPKPPAKSG